MPRETSQSVVEASARLKSLLAEIYVKSKGEICGLSRAQFDNILAEIARKYLAPDTTQNDICDFYASLRVEELAIARACAIGNERAWEVFLTRYREKLYEIAGYITKETSTARELADSIYADLYGTVTRDGQRTSKLASYTGRGSLEGWLRTVMAQEHVNRYRRQRRLVSLDEEAEEGAQFATAEPEAAIVADPRVEGAVDEVLAALGPEERFVLASYFLDERTLADVARSLGVHESTISRKLDKLAKSLRKQILASLGRRGMSRRQAQEALEVDVRDLRVNIRSRLAQETGGPAFSKKKAETPAGDGS
jgi:RNA polymerase sigma-70 factor (ECF subfamily)